MTAGHEQYLRDRSHGPENDRRYGFNWRLPLYGALGACLMFLPIMVYGSDLAETLYVFGVAPIIVILLLVTVAIRKRPRSDYRLC